MAKHFMENEKANAVGRVLGGEKRREVARSLGVSDGTIRRWVAKAERRETAQEKELADNAEEVRADIEQRLIKARDELLERVTNLAPDSRDLRGLSTALGIVMDKLAIAQGMPTERIDIRNQQQMDAAIAQLLSEEAAKEHADRD